MPIRDLMLVLLANMAWGFNFVASASSLQQIPPFLFTVLRFALVLLILFPLLKPPARGQWLRLYIVCVFTTGLHFGLNFWALKISSDISSVAIALQAYVPMTVILAIVFLGERIGWRTTSALVMAFIGVLVFGFDSLVLNQLDSLGLTLLAALVLAIGTIFMRGVRGVSPLAYQAWSALFSIPILLLLSWWFESGQMMALKTANPIHWAGVVYSALISSIIGHSIYFYLVQRHEVKTVMPYILLTPLFAVVFGVLFWGDEPGWRLLLGGAMILSGVFIITVRVKVKPSQDGPV